MPILEFRSSLDTTQQEELRNVRELMDNFLNEFEKAFQENSQEPIDQLDLLRMTMMDTVIRDLHTITLYEYQATEYLVSLFFTYIGTTNYTYYNEDLLKTAESSFINYCTKTGSDNIGVNQIDKDISLKSYYDLHDIAKEDCDAKFYFAVYTLCPLIMEYCRKEYIKFTTPTIKRIK